MCGGLFDPEECILRCTKAHNCAFATMYRNGWCQLGSKCVEEAEAGDSSAMTYAKVGCLGLSWSHDVMNWWIDSYRIFDGGFGMRIWSGSFGWLAATTNEIAAQERRISASLLRRDRDSLEGNIAQLKKIEQDGSKQGA